MTGDRNLGPPGGRDGEGRATPSPATVEEPPPSSPTPQPHRNRETHPWRRRRDASRRTERLGCGCGTRDPWTHTCDRPPLSLGREADAYKATVLHLRHCGLLAAPNIPAMQVLWRRSAEDRRLAAGIAEAWELAG